MHNSLFLTSWPDRSAGPTRTAVIQKIHNRHQSACISKTIALSASQIVAPLSSCLELHNSFAETQWSAALTATCGSPDYHPDWREETEVYKTARCQPLRERMLAALPNGWSVEIVNFTLGIRGSLAETQWTAALTSLGESQRRE
jgi:hypothetical protein